MKVGIGFSNEKNALVSGTDITRQAIQSGHITNAKFALAFCCAEVDANALLDGIRSVLGSDVPVLGGSAVGIITNDKISYENYPSGIVIVEDDEMQIQVAVAPGLDRGESTAGETLVRQLQITPQETLLLFYDSIQKPPGQNSSPVLNSSTLLLRGMENELECNIPIIGAGTLGDYEFSPTVQFTGDRIQSQCASALSLRGDFTADVKIMHGCSPKDGIYHTITKIDGAVLYEIDNRPAVDVFNEIYGNEDWQNQIPVKRLTIGVNHGERFWERFSEQDYVNRLIVGALPDKSGIVIYEEDFEAGTEFQFMLRDPVKMIESARENTEALIEEIRKSGKTPVWGFYIDCAGRNAKFSEIRQEEAQEVQRILNQNDIPLFGFYSGVEIAPFLNKNRGLDWTGVLTIFSV